jgi:hypothetical protein
MKTASRRPVLAAVVVLLAAVVGGLFLAGPAHAQAVETGSLAFSGDPGDYISGGQSYAYSTEAGDTMDVSGWVSAGSWVRRGGLGFSGPGGVAGRGRRGSLVCRRRGCGGPARRA